MLKAGEEKKVTFTIDSKSLAFYNADLRYVVEPGRFNVYIGLDSDDVKASDFTLL
jgi:beta-glucosidase